MGVVTENSWEGGDIKSVSGRKCLQIQRKDSHCMSLGEPNLLNAAGTEW